VKNNKSTLISPNNDSKSEKTIQFKIASINLFNYLSPPNAYYDFENIYSQAQWQKKQLWFSHFLAEQQPDVVGFQEVFSTNDLKSLCENSGYKYFSVIDEPHIENDFIYSSPVVAIASRFPIVNTQAVIPSKDLAVTMGMVDFNFSRKVLMATIELPIIGLCDCYVVHLKSKRADLQCETDNLTGLSTSASLLAKQALGRWVSDQQRGNEVALLFHAMLQRRDNTNNAMMLMGDFNDTLDSAILNVFNVQRSDIHNADIKMTDLSHLPDYAIDKSFSYYQLSDAYELYIKTHNTDIQNQARAPSHYFGTKGSVLDYILLSNEFNTDNNASLAEVSSYMTYDRHLINAQYDIDSHSTDHAPVVANIKIRD